MITQGYGTPRSIGGSTGKSLAEGFVSVRMEGVREMAEKLQRLGAEVGEPKALELAVRTASGHIKRSYQSKVGNVTGNLARSTRIETKVYDAATVAIVGPYQSGTGRSTDRQASGNHAWLKEFGSGPRRPGTKGRRTYVNVHQMINGKMRRHSSANDQQFANMSRGYYFLMGSRDEETRQARQGIGYPHDFGYSNGKQHPITLHPGDTYAPMPASHAMERSIAETKDAVLNTLKAAIQNSLDRLSK
jgi:hypothetical protein